VRICVVSLPALARSILPAGYVEIADIVDGVIGAGVIVWTARRILPKSGHALWRVPTVAPFRPRHPYRWIPE
jgi:hypothetical protein